MTGPSEFVRSVRDFLRAGDAEHRLNEEVRFHLEMEAEKNEREGMTPHEARRVAATRFGGVERHKESVRDARGFRWIDDLISDTRYAWRSLRRAASKLSGIRRSVRSSGDCAGSARTVRPLCVTLNATDGCAAAARSTCVRQCASSVASARRNLRRAGVL